MNKKKSSSLSPREKDVLTSMGTGKSISQTAKGLGIDPLTVTSAVNNAKKKFGLPRNVNTDTVIAEARRRGQIG